MHADAAAPHACMHALTNVLYKYYSVEAREPASGLPILGATYDKRPCAALRCAAGIEGPAFRVGVGCVARSTRV